MDGLLLAENVPGSFVHKGMFVQRDRLQSGLSLAIFPIETDVEGGTMHTVRFAREQGRMIFCPDVGRIPYERGYSKIRGIQKLLEDRWAEPYTKDAYELVLRKISVGLTGEHPSGEVGQLGFGF
jgi:DNA processing protein